MLPALTWWTGWHGFSVLRRPICYGGHPRMGTRRRKAGVNLSLNGCGFVGSRPALFASRAERPGEPRARKTRPPPIRKPDRRKNRKAVIAARRQPRNRDAVRGFQVSGAFQQSLRLALKLKARVLMRLATGQR